jgi:hypothetical protein
MTPLRSAAPLVLALAAAAAAPAAAQFSGAPPDQPDLTLDANARAAVIESLAYKIDRHYVFPDVGRATARGLRDRLKRGRYDRLTSAKEFADSVGADLNALAHDLHLRIQYSHRPLPPEEAPAGGADRIAARAEREREAALSRRLNHGFERVERLAGNVGYLELRAFDGSPEAGAVAQAAMSLLARTDAIIFDLRRNGGGDPNMIALLLSYLYDSDERVHVNDFYEREGNRTVEYWTSTTVPGPRLPAVPVYVEEFAYDIQALKRGTVIGEVSAGGANPGGLYRLGEHFAAFIATGRAINPVTKTNWEGTGVTPDVAVPAEQALATAHEAALTALIAKTEDAELKAARERALAQVLAAAKKPS